MPKSKKGRKTGKSAQKPAKKPVGTQVPNSGNAAISPEEFFEKANTGANVLAAVFSQLAKVYKQMRVVFYDEEQDKGQDIELQAASVKLWSRHAIACSIQIQHLGGDRASGASNQSESGAKEKRKLISGNIKKLIEAYQSQLEGFLPILEDIVSMKQEDKVLRMCQVEFLLNWLEIFKEHNKSMPFKRPIIERLKAAQAQLILEHRQLKDELRSTAQPHDQGAAASAEGELNAVLLENLMKLASSHGISAPAPDKVLSASIENVVAVCEAFIGEAYKKLEGHGSQIDQYQQTFMALQEASQRMSDEKIRQALRQDEQQTLDQADNSMAELRKSLEGQWDRKVFKDGYDLVTRSLDPRKVSPGDDDSMRLCVLYCFSVKISTVLAAWPSCEIHEGKLGEYQQQSEKLGQIIQRLRQEFEAKLEAIQRDPKALGTTSDNSISLHSIVAHLLTRRLLLEICIGKS